MESRDYDTGFGGQAVRGVLMSDASNPDQTGPRFIWCLSRCSKILGGSRGFRGWDVQATWRLLISGIGVFSPSCRVYELMPSVGV